MNGVVVSVHKTGLEILVDGEVRFAINKCGELPVVNDNVSVEQREDKFFATEIQPRKNFIARYDFYKECHHGFAANIDTVFIVTSATREFSLGRIKRFLALCEEQNVRKVVVMTKADLLGMQNAKCRMQNDGFRISELNLFGVEQININALDTGDVAKLTWRGTALLLGSSGVGKSTILNTLLGLNLKTREVQSEKHANKGRHTTSARTMYFLADGRRIIDTPGVRIVGVEGEAPETRRARKRAVTRG